MYGSVGAWVGAGVGASVAIVVFGGFVGGEGGNGAGREIIFIYVNQISQFWLINPRFCVETNDAKGNLDINVNISYSFWTLRTSERIEK